MSDSAARARRVDEGYARAPERQPLHVVGSPSAGVASRRPASRPVSLPDPERRTIEISSAQPVPRRRPRPRASARAGARPDRVALWAVVLALLLAFVAAASADGDEHSKARDGGASAPAVAPR